MSGALKKGLIFLVIIILVVVGYSMFAGDPKIETSLSSTPAVGVDETISADTQVVLALLQSVSNISLDTSIFDRQSYLALEDQNKILLPDLNPGRDNPFAPIGVDPIQAILPDMTQLDGQLNNLNDLGNLGSDSSSGTQSSASTIKTAPASGVTRDSAVLFGEILTANAGAERYFEYGLSNVALSNSTTKVVQNTPGTFSRLISNLVPNTTYYFQAVVKVGDAILKGEVQNFKTLP